MVGCILQYCYFLLSDSFDESFDVTFGVSFHCWRRKEWLERCDSNRHGLSLKRTCTMLLCL